MRILGIETTCDDTCVGIVGSGGKVLADVRRSQAQAHAEAAGVVPELASRCHLELLLPAIEVALREAGLVASELDAIAVADEPGLLGSLLVGVNTATALAWSLQKPLLRVNHLLAHVHSLFLTQEIAFPFLALLVSGGHTLLMVVRAPLQADIVGSTIDDACGEAFDKVAKHWGLGYPGGPEIDRLSRGGDDTAYLLPVAELKGEDNQYNFSYSGLKTAVVHRLERHKNPDHKGRKEPSLADRCASFQRAAIEPLYRSAKRAQANVRLDRIGICGGVAANSAFRRRFSSDGSLELFFPEPKFCTDNGVMVAMLAHAQAREGVAMVQPKDLASLRASKPTLRFKGKLGALA